jgi:hypothetical protein
MTTKFVLIACASVALGGSSAQESRRTAGPPLSLAQLNRSPWPHIGSPAAAPALAGQTEAPAEETRKFAETFAAIKGSWTGEEILSQNDLEFKVRQYEDLLATVTHSAGYGNVLLADCLRRLSQTMLIEYALGHPAESEALAAMLRRRGRLLDSPVVASMLAEELKLDPPNNTWHLVDSREEIETVFQATGSPLRQENRRLLFGLPNTADLMKQRDLPGLLLRVIESDSIECVHLPGLIEFQRLGGRLENLRPNSVQPYLSVMEHEMRQFQFAPIGINMLRQEHLTSLQVGFDPHGRKLNRFTRLALE